MYFIPWLNGPRRFLQPSIPALTSIKKKAKKKRDGEKKREIIFGENIKNRNRL